MIKEVEHGSEACTRTVGAKNLIPFTINLFWDQF